MKKYFKPILFSFLGLLLGAGITGLFWSKTNQKPISFTVKNNSAVQVQNMTYTSDKLPQIQVSQKAAVQKFKALYSSAQIKSIALTLEGERYIYNIIGFDEHKDCTIQIDATNNKILGQSTQVLDYAYDQDVGLSLNKTISRQKATQLALKEYPNSKPIHWELEADNGQALWKVYLLHNKHKHTVKIDAVHENII